MLIQRLNATLRNMIGLTQADAKSMHVLKTLKPERLPLVRYNVRKPSGVIDKYTLGDNFIKINSIKKIDGKYKEWSNRFFKIK